MSAVTVILLFIFSAFTPEQLVNAVQLATQFAIWMGFLSLLIEIFGAIIRYKLTRPRLSDRAHHASKCSTPKKAREKRESKVDRYFPLFFPTQLVILSFPAI